MRLNYNHKAFFSLVRAGLWEKEFQFPNFDKIDFNEIYRLAEEQSVVGLVAAGLEHIENNKVGQGIALTFACNSLQIEQRNKTINLFVADLIEKMRRNGIYAILVKGQGVAWCYERPLWRSSGDVDLLLSDDNYKKAKQLLSPLANYVESEVKYTQHLGMTISSIPVELHGNLRCGLSKKMDKVIDDIQNLLFCEGAVRSWINGKVHVFLPDATYDAILVFTHFLKHFYKGGIGIKQICDWCRLLYTYNDTINKDLLERKLHAMGLMSEWIAFSVFAVEFLGMPKNAIPFYTHKNIFKKKASRIASFIIKVGNLGQNRDLSYYNNKPYILQKVYSLKNRCVDLFQHVRIFPMDTMKFCPYIFYNGIRSAIRGE